MTRRNITIGIVATVALVALIWVVRAWSYSRGHESTDNAQVDGRIVPVLAKVGGYVKEVSVVENQRVRSGDVLLQIDDAEYRQRMAQADADLLGAMAASGNNGTPGQAQSQVQTASGQRSSLDAQITASRATSQRAQQDLARAEDLARQQIIPRSQLDAARATAEAAQANVVALERQASAATASVSNAQAGVRVAEAKLQAARAARDYAQLQLAYTRITTPEGGIVSRKQVEVGQLVQAGQPLMWIVADTGEWVTANFKETQLSRMHPGQIAEIEVDAYRGCVVEGKVLSISSATGAKFALLPPDNATGNFTKVVQRIPVRIQVTRGCGAERPLRPGMSVTAHVTTS